MSIIQSGVDPTPWVAERDAKRSTAADQWAREHTRRLIVLLAAVAVLLLVAVLLPYRAVSCVLAGAVVALAAILLWFAVHGFRHAAVSVPLDLDGMLASGWGVHGHAMPAMNAPMPPAEDRGVSFLHAGNRLETMTLVNREGRLCLYDGENRLVTPATPVEPADESPFLGGDL